MKHSLMAVGLLAGWFGSGISGDGLLKTETRPVSGFSCVANETPFPMNVSRGDGFVVSLNVDSNLLPLVETVVDRGCLRVSIREGTHVTSVHGSISVALPTLTGAAVAGPGSMSVRGFPSLALLDLTVGGSGSLTFDGTVSACSASLSGSGRIALSGHAERLKIAATGSGSFEAAAFRTNDLKAVLNGSGSTSVASTGDTDIALIGSGIVRAELAGGTARVHVTGSGQVHWTGPAHMDAASVSGSGRIVHD